MKGFQALAKRKRTAGAAVVAVVAKWKVGDLVLTKMKGFQAWPAMVSASSQKLLILYSLRDPYTGVADGRVVFWDGERWVPFATASPRWTQELCGGPKASLLEYLPTPGDGALHLTPVLRAPRPVGSHGSRRAGISRITPGGDLAQA
jgi:hypothetical protein